MTHHLGTKSFARLREEKTNEGVNLDELELVMIAYGQPRKKPVDPHSAAVIAEIEKELVNLPTDCDIASERERIFKQSIGGDKRGYKRTYVIGVKNRTIGTSNQSAYEALKMVEAERQKREALDVAMQEEKRKELEVAMEGEKKRTESLEEQVLNLTRMVIRIQATTKGVFWLDAIDS